MQDGGGHGVAGGMAAGRRPAPRPCRQCEAIKRRDRGEESLADIGRTYYVADE